MSAITLTHKIRLDPTCKQESYLRQACGVARFTWNWALSQWKKQYEAGHKPNGLDLKKQFNAIKPVEFPWTYHVTKYASQQPFIFLQTAFRRFFNSKSHYPQFKKKGVHDSFYIGNDHIKLDGRNIRIPKLGSVRMREALRFSGKVISATISRTADKWFVSLNVELDQPPVPCENQAGDLVGLVEADDQVVVSTNSGKPIVMQSDSKAGHAFKRIAKRLNGQPDLPIEVSGASKSLWRKIRSKIGFGK